jgi:hypothetical protein
MLTRSLSFISPQRGLPSALSRAATLAAWVPFGPTFGHSISRLPPRSIVVKEIPFERPARRVALRPRACALPRTLPPTAFRLKFLVFHKDLLL